MSRDDQLIEKSEGAMQIQNFCYDIAKELGPELESVYWSFEYVEPPESERHVLNIKAKNGTTTEIRFTRAEIEAYPMRHGTDKTNKKIKMELEGML
jgi:hypothetical protein